MRKERNIFFSLWPSTINGAERRHTTQRNPPFSLSHLIAVKREREKYIEKKKNHRKNLVPSCQRPLSCGAKWWFLTCGCRTSNTCRFVIPDQPLVDSHFNPDAGRLGCGLNMYSNSNQHSNQQSQEEREGDQLVKIRPRAVESIQYSTRLMRIPKIWDPPLVQQARSLRGSGYQEIPDP